MKGRTYRRARWLLSAVLFASPAAADDVDELRLLLDEDVVTTASSSAEDASAAPATSTTVTAQELRTYGIRTLAEAIDFLSLGLVTSDPLTSPEAGARGVLIPHDNGKHFLLLVNGHAMNDPLLGAARFDQGAGFPIDVVDRIEIIVGPGSVLYGSNAMLGVINVITKNAKNYTGGHVLGEFEPGRSVRTGAGAGATFDLFGQPSEVTTGVEYFERYGPDLSFDRLPPVISTADGQPFAYRRGEPGDGIWGGAVREAYFTKAASGLVRLRVGDVEASVMASTYQRGIPYTTDRLEVYFDDPDSTELDRALRLELKHQATVSTRVQLASRLYADTFDFQRTANFDATNGCFRSDFETCQIYEAGLARWAGIEERLSLNWLEDQSFVTMLGVDGRMRWVSAKQEQLDADTERPFAPAAGLIDRSAGVISPYLQQTWTPARWLDTNVGVRLTADERFSPILSPRGAVVVTPAERTTLKAVYSQAFRAPTFHETESSGVRRARALDLNPETVRSIEGSIEQGFGTQRLLFGIFRTWWDDLVEPRLLGPAAVLDLQRSGELPLSADGVVQSRNVSTIDNYGYNASFEGSLIEGRLSYGTNVTAAYTRRSSEGGSLPVAPQLFGNARAAYDFDGYLPTPALAVSFVDERRVDRGDRTAPALVRLRGTLTGDIPKVSGLAYRVTGNYATASRGPYTTGPTPTGGVTESELPLNPIDEFSVFFGLRYDFFTGSQQANEDLP